MTPEDLREAVQLLEDESGTVDILALIEQGREGGTLSGARQRLLNADLRQVGIGDLVERALAENLDLRVHDKNIVYARERINEVDAAFDPTTSLSLSYSRVDTRKRGAAISRLRENLPQGDDIELSVLGCVTVDGEAMTTDDTNEDDNGYSCNESFTWGTQYEEASSGSGSLIPNTWSSTLGVSYPFDWGGSLGASYTLKRDIKTSWSSPSSALYYRGSTADPWGRGGRWPWTTSYSLSFSTPFPFLRGWGESGSQANVEIAQARNSLSRARALRKSQRNTVLETVLTSYWELAQGLEEIRATLAHRQALEDRYTRIKRLFDSGRVTAYDITQLEFEIEKTKSTEELLWNSYLSRSNTISGTLALLGEGERNAVFLPVGFQKVLGEPVVVDEDRAYDIALQSHPNIRAGMEDVSAAKADFDFRENQLLPNVYLSWNYNASQNDTAFGYDSPEESIAAFWEPDSADMSITVNYEVPLWQGAEKAAFSKAKAELQRATDSALDTRNEITRAVADAVTSLRSAESLILQTKEDYSLAKLAYDKGQRLVELGLLSEFELLSRHQDLLSARFSQISALFTYRKAHIGLLSAEGILENYFAD